MEDIHDNPVACSICLSSCHAIRVPQTCSNLIALTYWCWNNCLLDFGVQMIRMMTSFLGCKYLIVLVLVQVSASQINFSILFSCFLHFICVHVCVHVCVCVRVCARTWKRKLVFSPTSFVANNLNIFWKLNE